MPDPLRSFIRGFVEDRLPELFRGPDPTKSWRPSVHRPLVLDLRTGAVSGIRPDAPYTDLADWGRPANRRPLARGHFVYPEMGITFLVADGRVSGTELEFQPHDVFGSPSRAAGFDGFRPAQLRIVSANGSEFHATPCTTVDEVRARFGEPAYVEDDPEGPVLTYERPGWQLEFDFDTGGVLSVIGITRRVDPSG